MYKRGLVCLVAAAAPAASFSFSFNMHNDFHAAVLKKLDGAFTDVFEICGVRGDDMNDAEDALLVSGVCMVVVVIMMVVVMRVRVRM
jgi:hypothetical protein